MPTCDVGPTCQKTVPQEVWLVCQELDWFGIAYQPPPPPSLSPVWCLFRGDVLSGLLAACVVPSPRCFCVFVSPPTTSIHSVSLDSIGQKAANDDGDRRAEISKKERKGFLDLKHVIMVAMGDAIYLFGVANF